MEQCTHAQTGFNISQFDKAYAFCQNCGAVLTPATKEAAQSLAIDWQTWQSEESLSYGDIAIYQDYFTELAELFGLTEEFQENGII